MSDDSTVSVPRAMPLPVSEERRPGATLDGFCAAAALTKGVRLVDLTPIEELQIWTRNSCYRMTVLDPHTAKILVQGGAFFPVTAEARLGGSTLGGSLLKVGWIGCGFCMELYADDLSIVTTPVHEIKRVSHDRHGAAC